MLHTLTGLAGILLYTAAAILLSRRLVSGFSHEDSSYKPAALLALAGVGLHGFFLYQDLYPATDTHFAFFNALSMVAWLTAALLLVSVLLRPLENLGVVVYPVAALCLGLSMVFQSESTTPSSLPPGLIGHIALAILAYCLLAIAALQALLLAYQDYHLRARHPGRIMGAMPPLQTMESLLFQVIGLGVFVLSLAILSGFVFLQDMFAQHVAHKTILSIAAWIIFTTLLWGRWRFGWRGRIAIRWSLTGFLVLMTAFFGTKVVFEFILGP